MSPALLSIDRLSKNFGGVRAVQSVSLAVPGGRIFSVIGPSLPSFAGEGDESSSSAVLLQAAADDGGQAQQALGQE